LKVNAAVFLFEPRPIREKLEMKLYHEESF